MARGILYSSMTSTGASVSCARLLALHFRDDPLDRIGYGYWIRILCWIGYGYLIDAKSISDRSYIDSRRSKIDVRRYTVDLRSTYNGVGRREKR